MTFIAAVTLAPGHVGAGTPVQVPGVQRPAGGVQAGTAQVYKNEVLTKDTFRTLPDSAVLEVNGQHVTKGDLLARAVKAHESAAAQFRGFIAQANGNLQRKRAAFRQQQTAGLEEANARVWAEVARLKQAEASAAQAAASDPIHKEAAELHQRYQGASPSERAQIEQRAGQLLRQLGVTPR